MKTSLKTLLVVLALLLALAPIICLHYFSETASAKIKNESLKTLQEETIVNAMRATSDITRMCELVMISDKTFADSVKMTLLQTLFNLGEPELDKNLVERVIRTSENPESKKKEKFHLLKFGDTVIDCAQSENKDSPINKILQELKQRLKYDFTIFVRKSLENDTFIALASTITNTLGENIAGSYLNGFQNLQREEIIKNIIENNDFSDLVNTPTSTLSVNYVPITDNSGNVVAVLYFGTENNSIKEINKYISTTNLGENSYAWIIDVSAPDTPIVKFSEQATENSVNINDTVSTTRKNLAYEIIQKSKALKDGQISYEIFSNSDDSSKKVILTYTYFHEWNWIIGTVSDSEEYLNSATSIAKNLEFEESAIIKAIIIICVIAVIIALLLAGKICGNLKNISSIMRMIANINPSMAIKHINASETKQKQLSVEFVQMQQSLKAIAKRFENVIDEILRDTSTLGKATIKISKLIVELNESNTAELVQMKDIAISGRNILTSAEKLNNNAIVSANEIQKALILNRNSENAIDALMRKYDTLAIASNNVSKKLADINNNAEKITALITTISDVSLKTNMLSLNASIEAEKVGETGLGFAVVSRQIRTLADKTSRASQDIENSVRQMQSSVNTAVMEMDRFSANMRENTKTTLETAKKLSSTISNIEGIGPKFENISERISDMSAIAVKITEAIKNLTIEATNIQQTLNRAQHLNEQTNTYSSDINKTVNTQTNTQ